MEASQALGATLKVSSETWSSLFTVKKDCIGIAGQGGGGGGYVGGGTGWSPLRNPLLSFLATARRSDGGHTVGGVGLGGAEGQFQRTRMVGWLTGNKKLSSASRGGDQRTGQSTVASTRSVNKPGTRVEAWRLGLGGVVSGSGRCATGCDAQLSELMEREEKKSHTIPARSGCFCKRRNSLAPVIKTCQSIHTPTLLGSKLPKFQPANARLSKNQRLGSVHPSTPHLLPQ